MSPPQSIDVVIPTRNRYRRLSRVITPLLEDPAVARVIVVDDSDSPDPGRRREEMGEVIDRVELVAGGGVGPAVARQRGVEAASAEILLLLDDDVVPSPGLAGRHLAHHLGGGGLLVCGYTPVVPVRPGVDLSPEAAVYGITYEKRRAEYERDARVVLTHLWGGNFSIARADATRVGLASDDFTQRWHEDQDFGLRCLENGMTGIFDPGILADHEYERDWEKVSVESFNRGYSLVVLHGVHPDTVEPVDPRIFERDLPWPAALIVRVGGGTRFNGAAIGLARAMRGVGAALHARRLQLAAVRLLRRVQGAAGARAATAARGGAS